MIGTIPHRDDFIPGFRFVTGEWSSPLFKTWGSSTRRAALLHTVISRDGDIFITRDQNNKEHTGLLRPGMGPSLGLDERMMSTEIMWADPLPSGPFDEIRVLADAMLHNGWRNRPYLLLCDALGADGAAMCRMIHPEEVGLASDARFTMEPTAYAAQQHGTVFVLDEIITVAAGADLPWEGWENVPQPYHPVPGDFFIAMDLTTGAALPPVITSAHLLKIASGMSAERIGEWMPSTVRRQGVLGISLGIATRNDLDFELDRAHARLQPDEIIVISVPTAKDDVHLQVLSKTGIKLHEVDCPSDDLYGTDLEPGIWLGSDIVWYDAGDDGAEWEADFRPATRADLDRHGLSAAEILSEWLEYAQDQSSCDKGRAMIASLFPNVPQQSLETDVSTR